MVLVLLVCNRQEILIVGLRDYITRLSARLGRLHRLSKPVAFEGFISSKSLRTLSVDVGSSEKGSVRFKC